MVSGDNCCEEMTNVLILACDKYINWMEAVENTLRLAVSNKAQPK